MSLIGRRQEKDASRLEFGDLSVDVVKKQVKNLRLSVRPPDAHVRVSAPHYVSLDTIRMFIVSKLDWIHRQQTRIRSLQREPEYLYLEGEGHYFAGNVYELKVTESSSASRLQLLDDAMMLHVRPGSSRDKREMVVYEWYRTWMKQVLPDMIKKYESHMDVKVAEFGVKRMKTRWGSCNIGAQRIWLNLELAKKPVTCLEYVVVHEMTHLLERSHNKRFTRLMDRFMPDWRERRAILNQSLI